MTAITVTAKKDGFRRAGRAWHGSVTVDTAEFTEVQLEQLHAEDGQALIITPAADPAPAGDGKAKAQK